MTEPRLTWPLIEEAQARIAGRVSVTPVLTSAALDELSGAQLYFKCETFQKGGAFKARGATNAVFALSDAQARHGVATHSSGNHAAALARAARLRGIKAYIVMPDNTPQAKRAAVAATAARSPTASPRSPRARPLRAPWSPPPGRLHPPVRQSDGHGRPGDRCRGAARARCRNWMPSCARWAAADC